MKNVLILLQEFGIQPKYVGTYDRGDVYHSACPRSGCSKEDGFHVWPDSNNGQGSWWCRNCGKGGDGIEFLKEFKGLSYKDAADYIGKTLKTSTFSPKFEQKKPEFKPKEAACPVDQWQQRAKKFIDHCNAELLKNKKQLQWLETRGISVESVKKYKLGWNAEKFYRARSAWGLPEKLKNKKSVPLFIPAGIVIPTIEKEKIYKINIRRGPGDYLPVAGSKTVPKILGHITKGFIVVETELDGFMLRERVGDMVSIFVLGSVTIKPLQEQYELLKKSLTILISLDFDGSPGAQNSKWWLKNFDQAKRYPVSVGKDPGEAFQRGLNIRKWILKGLPPALTYNKTLSGFCNVKFKKGEEEKKPCPRNEKKIIKEPEGVHEDVRQLYNIIKAYPDNTIQIIKDGGNRLLKQKKWFQKQCKEKGRTISALVFSVYCGRYIDDHPAEIINRENFWDGIREK